MGSEATKERVTAVLFKSKLLAYFRFSVHPLTSCTVSLTVPEKNSVHT